MLAMLARTFPELCRPLLLSGSPYGLYQTPIAGQPAVLFARVKANDKLENYLSAIQIDVTTKSLLTLDTVKCFLLTQFHQSR
jgi:hypothetical protein